MWGLKSNPVRTVSKHVPSFFSDLHPFVYAQHLRVHSSDLGRVHALRAVRDPLRMDPRSKVALCVHRRSRVKQDVLRMLINAHIVGKRRDLSELHRCKRETTYAHAWGDIALTFTATV